MATSIKHYRCAHEIYAVLLRAVYYKEMNKARIKEELSFDTHTLKYLEPLVNNGHIGANGDSYYITPDGKQILEKLESIITLLGDKKIEQYSK